MKLFNTLTHQKETFRPIEAGKISMYVCGPTVYNYIHIGNARSAVAFDTMRRYFEYRGFDVTYVSNFTDVDDKIIKAGRELNLSPREVADKFIAAFYEDIERLNIKKATLNPRVMDSIEDIIAFISELMAKGYAYEVQGDVYFRTAAFKHYGKLSGQSLAELKTGASDRVDPSEVGKKESPLDFALWKKAKEDEIKWESPWGQGRPGWHIECSVMATTLLGDTIDIHAGGQDLTFPHHENEIAQSEAKTGHPFAHYWLHNGFVTFDGEKMSKSLGNFIFARDFLNQVDPEVVRFLLASAHYRHPLAFSNHLIEEATNNVSKIKQAYHNLDYRIQMAREDLLDSDNDYLKTFEELEHSFVTEMDDDINVPNGLMVVYQMVKVLNKYSEEKHINREMARDLLSRFAAITLIFGLSLLSETLPDEDILALIEERRLARLKKDFKRSDDIRQQLKERGILLDDTPQGTRFKRVSLR